MSATSSKWEAKGSDVTPLPVNQAILYTALRMSDPDAKARFKGLAAVAEQFGVDPDQAHRDHLISHLLATLRKHFADQVLFFGGTALSRTFFAEDASLRTSTSSH